MKYLVCETCETYEPIDDAVLPAGSPHVGHRGLVIDGADEQQVERTAVNHIMLARRIRDRGPNGLSAQTLDKLNRWDQL